jgi:chromosome segregation ATPase
MNSMSKSGYSEEEKREIDRIVKETGLQDEFDRIHAERRKKQSADKAKIERLEKELAELRSSLDENAEERMELLQEMKAELKDMLDSLNNAKRQRRTRGEHCRTPLSLKLVGLDSWINLLDRFAGRR